MRRRIIPTRPLLLALLLLSASGSATAKLYADSVVTPPTHNSTLAPYSWDAVAGATYYLGHYETPAGNIRFRTSSNRVLLPASVPVHVEAYSPRGRIAGRPKKIIVKSESMKPAAPIPTETVTPAPAPTTANMDYDDDYDDDNYENAADSPSASSLEKSAPYESDAGVAMPLFINDFYATAIFGVGSESLKSDGGASKFKGDATVGTLKFKGYSRADNSRSMIFGLQADAHIFSALKEEQSDAGTTKEAVTEHTRVHAFGGPYFDLRPLFGSASATNFLYGGLGLGFLRMPALEVGDIETSTADLKSFSGAGPFFSAHYIHLVSPGQQSLSSSLTIIPHLIGTFETGSSLVFDGRWQYFFTPAIHSDLGFVVRRDAITTKAGCTDESSCRKTSTASSAINSIEVGIGAKY